MDNWAMVPKRQTELFCEWLDGFLDYERIRKTGEFSLETMRYLVERLKRPERSFEAIHVAGSKGKGSVSVMLSRILETTGIPCGLYLSPHLTDFTERVGTARGPFTQEIYGAACDRLVPLVDSIIPGSIPGGLEPSWFELVTLFAFVTFREAGVPWAIVETGLGGRLDATNVLSPRASVITHIELEHTEYLGSTVELIAREKAGIIKKGVPVFVGRQRPSVRSVFEEAAIRAGSPAFFMDDAIEREDGVLAGGKLHVDISFRNLPGGAVFARPIRACLSLINSVQVHNAAIAAYTAKFLFPSLGEDSIEEGLSRAWLPGRFEVVSSDPLFVLDGAHTPESVMLTIRTFLSMTPGPASLLFACAADKDVDSIAVAAAGSFGRITLTRPGERKVSDVAHARKAFENAVGRDGKTELRVEEDYVRAIAGEITRAEELNEPLLVTGSFYLVAEVKRFLADRPRATGS